MNMYYEDINILFFVYKKLNKLKIKYIEDLNKRFYNVDFMNVYCFIFLKQRFIFLYVQGIFLKVEYIIN